MSERLSEAPGPTPITTMRLPTETMEQLNALCVSMGLPSRSAVVRELARAAAEKARKKIPRKSAKGH